MKTLVKSMWSGCLAASCLGSMLTQTPAIAALRDVRDYPSPAAAIAAAADGDRIYFPSPGPYVAPPGGWRISKSLELFGDGPGDGTIAGASSIVPDASGNAFVLDSTVTLVNIALHDLLVVGAAGAKGRRAPVRLTQSDLGTHTLSGLRIERVEFVAVAGDAILLDGGARNAIMQVSITDCEINSAGGNGVTLRNTPVTSLRGGYIHDCRGFGLYGEAALGVRLFGVAFEHNQLEGRSNDQDSQLRLKLCHGFTVIGGHFEEFSSVSRPARTAITIENCRGGQLSSNVFMKNAARISGSRGILIHGASQDIDVGSNSYWRVDTLVAIRSGDGTQRCSVRHQNSLDGAGDSPTVATGTGSAVDFVRSGLSGDLAATSLLTPPGEGLYRVTVVLTTLSPGPGRMNVKLEWSDGAPRSAEVIAGFDLSAPGGSADGSCTAFLVDGRPLTLRTRGAGSAARYTLRVHIECL